MGSCQSRAQGNVNTSPPPKYNADPSEATITKARVPARNRTSLLDQLVTASQMASTSSGAPTYPAFDDRIGSQARRYSQGILAALEGRGTTRLIRSRFVSACSTGVFIVSA